MRIVKCLTNDSPETLHAEGRKEGCNEEVGEEGGVLKLADNASLCEIHL